MSRKCRNVKKQSISWEIDLERKYKRDNWEVFQRVANGGGYQSRDRHSIFDVMYDIINKHLKGLECEHSIDGIKELYFKNG